GLSSASSDPGAATTKARVWMLRALRDGIRTSQDLELAAGKRAVPLLLAMADSAVGDGDVVILGLVLDVLCRVSRLERSGARYLLNSVGLVAWCRLVLGRGLTRPLQTAAIGKANGTAAATAAATSSTAALRHRQGHPGSGRNLGGGRGQRGAATVTVGGLPVHLQVQTMSLLTRLLRCGRRLAQPPALLEEEFCLLAPDIVLVLVEAAAAAAAVTSRVSAVVGKSDGSAGSRGTRSSGYRGGAADTDAGGL
ncbi:unnamed protein product, partial [Laminaria digitata]